MRGVLWTISVPTLVAKKASSFHGSRYPEKPKPMLRAKRMQPVHHVSSRGRVYNFRRNTENIWTKAARTMRLADQEWMDRTSQPKRTRVMMNCTLSNAASAVGR